MTTKTTVRTRAAGAALSLAALLLSAATGCTRPALGQPPAPAAGAATTTPAPPPVTARPRAAAVSYPADGGNRWHRGAAETPASGGTGRLLRYRVAVERDIQGLPVTEFAAEVSRTLNDPQGWTAGGTLRLRRVGWGQPADFTIYLATPGTRDELCQDLHDGYTSCRNGNRVVLNVARWVKGVPHYGASLATYRWYMINHEVGHRLGMGHERCPGRGRPAPVMQQQSLGLHGCTANALPYLDGERYTGPPGAYDDPLPPRDRGRLG
ncbi:DUF3152 domain-containing protein [Micromonospora sp. U56]|uniref:DUF3152 domain-containing protein n=1 Tax=Micromonospora sp. U56 TaxID=2824900 RepID=UPI001B38CE3F|nr:DUF3152 domain-containing protein [Micromonospora sp. U56]MBQ0894629.1 DUF3152 domain-containing protein [Micromonospora sp. U56]